MINYESFGSGTDDECQSMASESNNSASAEFFNISEFIHKHKPIKLLIKSPLSYPPKEMSPPPTRLLPIHCFIAIQESESLLFKLFRRLQEFGIELNLDFTDHGVLIKEGNSSFIMKDWISLIGLVQYVSKPSIEMSSDDDKCDGVPFMF